MTYSFKFSFSLFLVLLAAGLTAQSGPLAQLTEEDISPVVSMEAIAAPFRAATFPGGHQALSHELAGNLAYPELARDYAVEGTVVVRVSLTEDGLISEKTVVSGLGFGCDEAALKALAKLPRWNAARRGTKHVSGIVYVPLRFRLQ